MGQYLKAFWLWQADKKILMQNEFKQNNSMKKSQLTSCEAVLKSGRPLKLIKMKTTRQKKFVFISNWRTRKQNSRMKKSQKYVIRVYEKLTMPSYFSVQKTRQVKLRVQLWGLHRQRASSSQCETRLALVGVTELQLAPWSSLCLSPC